MKHLSPLNARIDPNLFYRLKCHVVRCKERGTDDSQEKLIERAIKELLDREENQNT